MKTIKTAVTLIFLLTSFFGNAQLKVHSNGKVSVATTANTGWSLTVAGYSAIKCIDGSAYLRFSPGASDAVIGSSSDVISFWDSYVLYHDIHCEDVSEHSDSLFKTNIVPLESGLETVLLLKPKSYNRKTENSVENVASFGFLAQEVQLIKPELVVMGRDSTLLLRTTQIIPYLVSAIQEQQTQIDSLINRVTELENSVYQGGIGTKSQQSTFIDENGNLIELGQNNPNPFKESTVIPYQIPETSKTAQIIIYDMRGQQLKSYDIVDFGRGELIIEGSSFKAGMYMYALIVDGVYIDSKRMILSK